MAYGGNNGGSVINGEKVIAAYVARKRMKRMKTWRIIA